MKYEIIGDNMPAAICDLKAGEGVFCEAGAMAWMDPQIEMRTEGGTFEKMLGRIFSGDKLMRNHYVAKEDGSITFSANYPGQILAFELNGESIIAQKGSFLASDESVDMDVFFQKKISHGLFSGEGFRISCHDGRDLQTGCADDRRRLQYSVWRTGPVCNEDNGSGTGRCADDADI